MIVETGTVVAIESDGLWVETIQKTACEACVAQKGCGTRVLSKLTGKTNRIRVLLGRHSAGAIVIGQDVDNYQVEISRVNLILPLHFLCLVFSAKKVEKTRAKKAIKFAPIFL